MIKHEDKTHLVWLNWTPATLQGCHGLQAQRHRPADLKDEGLRVVRKRLLRKVWVSTTQVGGSDLKCPDRLSQ